MNEKVECVCHCGNIFSTYQHLLVIGKGKHCSRKCYEVSKRKQGQTHRICAGCKENKALADFPRRRRSGTILCGPYCKACNRKRQADRSKTLHARWMEAKWKAIKKYGETGWAISEQNYQQLLSQTCHYCKGPLNASGIGLDRKCNGIGYDLANVVPCCKQCNVVKNNFFSYEEMLLLAPTLELIRRNRCLNVCDESV